MDSSLFISDPLAGQEVAIVITVAASDGPREGRAALVSVGVTEQMPVARSGAFGEIPALIDAAWAAFGLRAAAETAAETAVEGKEGRDAEAAREHLAAEEPAPTAAPCPAPKPQAQNLSLF
jgi:hypothetical protein